MLKKGKVFKNFKELCISMGWIDNEKTLSTCSKKKFEKDLSQLCSWKKVNGTNKIYIEEVYNNPKRRNDGRSNRSKYIPLIELILLNELSIKKYEFITTEQLVNLLGIWNVNPYFTEEKYREFALQYSIDEYTTKIIFNNFIGEINKIITRAMKSFIRNGVIDGQKGMIVVKNSNKRRLADEKEQNAIKDIEREVLNQLGCRDIRHVMFKNLNMKFRNEINKKLWSELEEPVDGYYNGYNIIKINLLKDYKLNEEELEEAKEELKRLIRDRLIELGERIHTNSVKKEYEQLTFGTPMLVKVESSSSFPIYCKFVAEKIL